MSRWASVLPVVCLLACGDGDSGGRDFEAVFETTPLCSLVAPPRPGEPARVPYGTDLGFSYERDGTTTLLFGDTWDQIETCPIQTNDDSLATLDVPADWPGFDARAPIADAACPELRFALAPSGSEFAPIELERWDGVPVPLGPLNTPLAGFHDGEREWGVFIIGGGVACSADDAAAGAPCPTDLDPHAGNLECAFVAGQPVCIDPTSPQGNDAARQAVRLHIAERVGTTSYVSRAVFTTNKLLNLTVRAVRAFDPANGDADYRPGIGALLGWGRPGFDATGENGAVPPYLFYHPLPLEIVDGRIDFEPRYFRGLAGDRPEFGPDQALAEPLYADEFDLVNQTAVSYIAPIDRWLMLYGGDLPDVLDPAPNEPPRPQPVEGAIHARLAPDPWGPWTEPEPVLTPSAMADRLVCAADDSPAGCVPDPDPPIRPECLAVVDAEGAGRLYGAAVIDALTREAQPAPGSGPAADVYWNISTWHPYGVVLVKTRIENGG